MKRFFCNFAYDLQVAYQWSLCLHLVKVWEWRSISLDVFFLIFSQTKWGHEMSLWLHIGRNLARAHLKQWYCSLCSFFWSILQTKWMILMFELSMAIPHSKFLHEYTVMPIFRKFSEIRKSENSAENFRNFSEIQIVEIWPNIPQNTLVLTQTLNSQISPWF